MLKRHPFLLYSWYNFQQKSNNIYTQKYIRFIFQKSDYFCKFAPLNLLLANQLKAHQLIGLFAIYLNRLFSYNLLIRAFRF